MSEYEEIVEKIKKTVISAGSSLSKSKQRILMDSYELENNDNARWVLSTILENERIAYDMKFPLCDDTGIPHVVVDVGEDENLTGVCISAIYAGIQEGLRELPGRPMAVLGEEIQKLEQSIGLNMDSGAVLPAPFIIRPVKESIIRVHVLLMGGGPEIRSRTYRVFHKHSINSIIDEIVSWAVEGTTLLGCTPSTLGVGIGRSHYEASSLMIQALVDGEYGKQSILEKEVTNRVNLAGKGTMGLGGNTTVLATFMKIGEQRASGVRIVCVRPCCCFEPRVASVIL